MDGNLEIVYSSLIPTYELVKNQIVSDLQDSLENAANIDRIYGRVKETSHFIEKAKTKNGKVLKFKDPIHDITDQIGIRVITYYRDDVNLIKGVVEHNHNFIERDEKKKKENEFGYEAVHYIAEIPSFIVQQLNVQIPIHFFELQICTLFQHAWAEANHDIMYKNGSHLTKEERKKLNWAAAQAWGTDRIFSEVYNRTDEKNIL